MEKYISLLAGSALFEGISEKEINALLFYLNPVLRKYKRGEVVLRAGSKVESVCIVLSGVVQVVKEDVRGLRSIMTECGPSDMFAEALAAAKVQRSPVGVLAKENCEVMFINFEAILRSAALKAGKGLIENMLTLLARKNVFLNNKLEHVSKRSIREKLLSYFSDIAFKSGAQSFTLPMSKTDTADFLFIDRSAMVREMGHMQRDGLLKYRGRQVALKQHFAKPGKTF